MIYTTFQVFCLAAFVVIAILIWNRTGFSQEQYIDYYRGNEARDLYGKTPAQLLEVTHFHLFSYPVFLLIQGHIFLLTSWPRPVKAAIVIASFVGAAIYLAVPWLVAFVSPDWVWLKPVGRLLLLPPLLVFLVVPVFEMWFLRAPPNRHAHSHAHAPPHRRQPRHDPDA